MERYIFTDLACETASEKNVARKKISERIERAEIIFDSKERKDRHITFFTPKLWSLGDNEFDILKAEIAKELQTLARENCVEKAVKNILIAGIGNPTLTPDALGAQTVKGIYVTQPSNGGAKRISAIIPDVVGNTGIETLDTVKAYVSATAPDVVIVIDSLRARSYERLAGTVQLSDGGIIPGSGVKNGKMAICSATVGVPVISVGVPTVVSSSTMICDVINKCGGNCNDPTLRYLLDNGLDFFVSPKEVDILIRSAALLLSSAINAAFAI